MGTAADDVVVTVLDSARALRADPLDVALLEDGLAGTYTVRMIAEQACRRG